MLNPIDVVPMDNRALALKAFNLADMIRGISSGGIEPPRVVLNAVEEDNGCRVMVRWTYPRYGGYSDVTYHYTDAGKEFTDVYDFSNLDKITCNGSEDIFGIGNDQDLKSYADEFYSEWRNAA